MKTVTGIIVALALAGFFAASGCEKGGQAPESSQPTSSAPTGSAPANP